MNYHFKTIMMGDPNSPLVKKLQKRLNHYGAGPIVEDGVFGKKTLHAVKSFQSSHCDSHSHPLAIDGEVGLLTWSCLFEEETPHFGSSDRLRDTVIQIAIQEIDTREEPPHSHKGQRVEEYLRSVHEAPGSKWNGAFVYWCFQMACAKLLIPNPLPRSPLCIQQWKKAEGERIRLEDALSNPSLIEPGLIFFITRGDGAGHAGIVTGFQEGHIYTVEGNTNNTRASDGLKVCAMRRLISTISPGFIKYSLSILETLFIAALEPMELLEEMV